MAEPKAAESMVERRICEAIEAGEFDHLEGEGCPIPGAGTRDDEYWWVRRWMERNGVGPSQIELLTRANH